MQLYKLRYSRSFLHLLNPHKAQHQKEHHHLKVLHLPQQVQA
jgi:hypothetical protein